MKDLFEMSAEIIFVLFERNKYINGNQSSKTQSKLLNTILDVVNISLKPLTTNM